MGWQAWKELLRAVRLSPAHLLFPLRTAEHPQPEIHSGLKEGCVLGGVFPRKWDGAVVLSHGEDRTQKHLWSRQPAVPSSASHSFIWLGRRVPGAITPLFTCGSSLLAVGSRAVRGKGEAGQEAGRGKLVGEAGGGRWPEGSGRSGPRVAAPKCPRSRARMRDPGKAPEEHTYGGVAVCGSYAPAIFCD